MSTRTIIEINHDYLTDLLEDSSFMKQFLWSLRAVGDAYEPPGVRVLAQRHHSDTLVVTINRIEKVNEA
jgi:hypothetical protein